MQRYMHVSALAAVMGEVVTNHCSSYKDSVSNNRCCN